MAFQGCGCLRHLHQGSDSLLHPGASGTGVNDNGKPLFCGPLNGSGDLLAHSPSHACHEKTSVADSDHCLDPVDPAFSCHYRFMEFRFFPDCFQFFRVSFVIYGVAACEIFIPLLESPLVDDHLDPAICVHAEISPAFRADIVSCLYILRNDRGAAFITLAQKAFRHLRPHGPAEPVPLCPGRNPGLFEHIFQLHNLSLLYPVSARFPYAQ